MHKNRSKFENASVELQREAAAKWEKLYPRTPWPLKAPPEADNEEEKVQMIKVMGDYFSQEDITKALRENNQTTLTACDMAMLRTIYKYLRENAESAPKAIPEDLS